MSISSLPVRSFPRSRMLILLFVFIIALSLSVLMVTAFAQTREEIVSDTSSIAEPESQPGEVLFVDSDETVNSNHVRANSGAGMIRNESTFSLDATPETTLTVQILSPPWATLDNDHPGGGGGQIVPSVFVVEAVVTNTGPTTATWVDVNLDYNESIPGNWLLLNDENPKRTIAALSSAEAAHLYWFATYSTTIGTSHIYTVTADGENTNPVSTSDNFYNPLNPTVQTRGVLDTGSSGIISTTADVVVGVAFTITTNYDLGTNPDDISLTPAGNPAFNPGAYQLLKTRVSFYDNTETLLKEVDDRVYFPALPDSTRFAEATYVFIARTPEDTSLCSHATVGYGTNWKYDNQYCTAGQVINVEGRLTYSMTKRAIFQVQQSQNVTYTLDYTNTGDIPLTFVWVWDEVNRDHAAILTSTITPTADIYSSTLAAWYLNDLPEFGQPGSTGTHSFAVNVDGNGFDLPDGTQIVNHAFFGISQAGLPNEAALTETFTTTVQAPTVSISKTDGLLSTEVGEPLTYTIRILNTGSVTATDLIITDTFPAGVNVLTPSPPPDYQDAEKFVWYGASIGELAPFGGAMTITLPVTVSPDLETYSVLTNTASIRYANPAGYIYSIKEVQDTTTVFRKAGWIVGNAYNDANGNGSFDDATEEGLAGVTVTLPAAFNPITYTDNDGYYRFRLEIESPPPISVTAAPVEGFFRTTPGTIYTDTYFGITQTVDFGYAPVTSTFGVIYGTVFDDEDHDGIRFGENGIPGVVVSSTGAISSPKITNEFGYYTFRYDEAGGVTLTEENPQYYVSTTPDVIQTDVVAGSNNDSPYDFGDFLGIKVSGQVFEDLDVDGEKDVTEPGLADAYVFSNQTAYTTTSTGYYSLYLTISDPSPITVTEDDPQGYISTNAIPGPLMSRVDANNLFIGQPISGTVYSGSFGDVFASSAITISGYVWNDNGPGGDFANGQPDLGEPFLAGAVISLSSGLTQTTGADGSYIVYAPPNSTITVTETNPDGYASTNAIPGNDASKIDNDRIQVGELPGSSTSAGNLFGDVLLSDVAVITGTVFYDLDLDGFFDPDEVGFSGVTVTMEISGGNTIVIQTNAEGNYQFAVTPGINVLIASSGPRDSYYPTTPESFSARPPSAGVYPNNNFGYSDVFDQGVITGIVFNDEDGDGEQDLGEIGLPSAVITLTDSMDVPLSVFTTTGNGLITGTFTFSVPRSVNAIYGVHEQNPPGYRSTTPDVVYVQVDPSIPTYYVEFGDTNNPFMASIYGTVFDDFNANGDLDPGETGLTGVFITVTSDLEPLTTTTKQYGQFTFPLYVEGIHTVEEQDPAKEGYHSTTPDLINVAVEFDNSYAVNFGDTDADTFNILGVVFHDRDGDGVHDPLEEEGLSGVTITLSTNGTDVSGPYGEYNFAISDTGFVKVFETDPEGFYSTTPNTVTVNITETIPTYQVDFGDRDKGLGGVSFFGTVFDDQNFNAARDNNEIGISGVTMTITSSNGVPFDPYLTNEWGQFTFLIEYTGTYTLTETDPVGYGSTAAIPGDPAVSRVNNNTLRSDIDASYFGSDLGDNLFGDALAADLSILKSDHPDPVIAGTTLVYTLTYENKGPNYAQNVVVSDTLPAEVAFGGVISQPAEMSGPVQVGESYVWSGQDLVTGPVETIVYSVTVNSNVITGTTLTNHVTVSSNTPDIVVGNNATQENTLVAQSADLVIGKTDGGKTAIAGETFTYTLTVINLGPSDANGVLVTDTLPVEMSFVYASGATCSAVGQAVTCDPFDISFGDPPVQIVLTVDVAAWVADGEVLTNTVEAFSDVYDPSLANNTADETTPVGREVDLQIQKSDDGRVATAGEAFTYTLTVNNLGPSDASGVVVTDTLPSGMSFVSANGATCSAVDQTVTCDPFDTNFGDSPVQILLTVDVAAWVAEGEVLTNSVEAYGNEYDPLLDNNTATENTPVAPETDISIQKSDDGRVATAGETFTYTLSVSNLGPSDASGVVVTDTLPSGMDFFSASGVTCSAVDQTVTCDPFSINFGDPSVEIVLTVDVAAWLADGEVLTNSVKAFGDEYDPFLDNNSVEESTPVGREADIEVQKTDGGRVATAGEIFTYTLTVNNLGPSDASGVVVTDTLPSGMIFLSASGATCNAADQTVTCDPFDIASGDLPVQIVLTVDVATWVADGEVLTNSVEVYGNEYDPSLGNNTDEEITPVGREADVEIHKTDDERVATAGEAFTYTLTVANLGPSDTSGVVVTDTLPTGMSYLSASGATCSEMGQTVTCDPFNIGFGSPPVEIVMTVDVAGWVEVGEVLTNTVIAFGDEFDPQETNNTAKETTLVTTVADLAITKQTSADPVAAGGVLTYTVSYQNNGLSDAVEVMITDTLPANVEFGGVLSEDPPMDSFNFDGTNLVWYQDQIADQATGAIIFTVTVKPDAVGSVINDVEIRSGTYDDKLNNNQDTTVTGIGTEDLATIWGVVFEDANCDGLKDTGENGIAGVEVTLDGSDLVQTDEEGIYVFLTNIPGLHAVVESDPAGYFSTTPNEVHLIVDMGSSYQVDFGEAPDDAQCAAIYGTVFDDLDKDTYWGTQEPGLTGVEVQIVGGVATSTNDYGSYTLVLNEEGSKIVEEQNPPGYISTTPNFVNVDVELGYSYEVNFGDVLSCTCSGDSFEEDDVWDHAQILLLGKNNAQSRNLCDDDEDWIAFSADMGDVYTITTDALGVRADTYMELYGTDGETLLTSTDDYASATNFSSQIVWLAPRDGTYYIRVTNRAGLVGCQCEYEIWLQKVDNHFQFLPVVVKNDETGLQNWTSVPTNNFPQGVITHICADTYEIDDTWWLAKPIEPGVVQTHSFDSNPEQYAADKDFVYVDLKAREVVTFTVASTINTQTSLELYDSQGIALNVIGTDQIVWEAPESNRYYLGVIPFYDTFGCPGTVGYELVAEIMRVKEIFLPVIIR